MPEKLYTVTVKYAGKNAEITKDLTDADATKLEKIAWQAGALVVDVLQQK